MKSLSTEQKPSGNVSTARTGSVMSFKEENPLESPLDMDKSVHLLGEDSMLLDLILQKSAILAGSNQNLDKEYEDSPIDYMPLLEGKIIMVSEQEQQRYGSERGRGVGQRLGRKGRRKGGGGGGGSCQRGSGQDGGKGGSGDQTVWARRNESLSPFINSCTRQQVSWMGNRRVPLHIAGLGEAHSHLRTVPPPTKDQLLEALDPHPSSEVYTSWLEQKQIVFDDTINNMTLKELLEIHDANSPGEVEIPLMWNAVGKAYAEFEKWVVAEDACT